MEKMLKQILDKLDTMDSSIKNLEVGQKELASRQEKLELSQNKLIKKVSEIKNVLYKGAYIDIQKLEKRV